jgi:hypothetical protein
MGQIGITVAAPRGSADRAEHRIGLGHRLVERRAERQPRLLDIAADEVSQTGLVERISAAFRAEISVPSLPTPVMT